jgi:hypothetical protein
LPELQATSYSTTINNCIDLALEEISQRHNFRCLRSNSYDTAALPSTSYYIDSTSFSTAFGADGYLKDILAMFRLLPGKPDYSQIHFLDDITFHKRFGYIDYANREKGYPTHYTRLGDRFIFNCCPSENSIIRIWYQKYHAPLATDTSTMCWYNKDAMIGFNAVLYATMSELKRAMQNLEFPQELADVTQRYEYWVSRLIERDIECSNESFEIGWAERPREDRSSTDPYEWV